MELYEVQKDTWDEKIEGKLQRKRDEDLGKAGSSDGKGSKRKSSVSQVEVSLFLFVFDAFLAAPPGRNFCDQFTQLTTV